MNRTRALPTVLEVLDDGLRLYRRNLGGFMLVSTAVLVVIAMVALGFMAFVRSEIGTTAGWVFLALFVLLITGYPLVIYVFAALSRATAAALDGQPISLTAALRINPVRGCGMVLYNILFSIIAAIMAGFLSFALFCPMTYLSVLVAGVLSTVSSGGTFSAAFGFVGVISQLSTLWSLSLFGAWLTSTVYALQAFVLEQQPWGASASRSLELMGTRFGQSVLMFLGAGAIFATLTLSYLGSLLVLALFVQDRLNLNLPAFATDTIVIVLIVAALVLLLPPLAIWMTMFYRRLALERDGSEIARRVGAWRAQLEQVRA